MGSMSKIIKDVSGSTHDEKEQKERLELLLKLAKAKMQTYKDKIEMNFTNPAVIDKIQIPGIRAMRYIEQYHVAAKEGFDKKAEKHIEAAIDAFFSIGGEGETRKAVQDGIRSLITTALSEFIGSTEAGESEQQIYVIIPENNAFIRADIACWKYHFEQHKFIHQTDIAIAYLLCKSVVDHTKITLDELIYLATESMSKRRIVTDQEVDVMSHLNQEAKNKINVIIQKYTTDATSRALMPKPNADDQAILNQANVYLDFNWESSKEDLQKGSWKAVAKSYQMIDGIHSHSKPAGISDVSAYIEELIKVWRKLKDERDK